MWKFKNGYLLDLSRIEKGSNWEGDCGYNWEESLGRFIGFKSGVKEKYFMIDVYTIKYDEVYKDANTFLTLMDYTGKQYQIRVIDILHGNLDSLFIQKD